MKEPWHIRNKEKANKIRKAWRANNPDKARDQAKRYYKRTPEKQREIRLKHVFGITPQQFKEMSDSQGGKCKICDIIPKENLCIDHNHVTNRIRGLLCRKCNATLGLLKENINNFNRAIQYLKDDYKANTSLVVQHLE